jgi:tetratricopeptide (TPR) repeat protein
MRLCLILIFCVAAAAQDPVALSEQAQQFAGQQRFDEAERLWKQAIGISPGFFPALFNLGYFYFKQQRFAEAEPLLRRATEASHDDFNAWYLRGAALSKLARSEDALRSWREALRIQPRNLRLMQVMSVEYYRGRYFGEAAALARQALELKTDDPNAYFLAIKAYQDAGDDTAAAEIAVQAVERFPSSARANFEYAYHLQKQGKIAEAEERFQRAMKADPTYEEPFFFYGNLLVDQDRNLEAAPYLEQAIKNRNDYVPARVVLARALMNQKKWQEAIAGLRQTIELDPKHPQPHLLLSQIYFRLGDEAKAKQEKEISLRLRRENPSILEAPQTRPFPAQ